MALNEVFNIKNSTFYYEKWNIDNKQQPSNGIYQNVLHTFLVWMDIV